MRQILKLSAAKFHCGRKANILNWYIVKKQKWNTYKPEKKNEKKICRLNENGQGLKLLKELAAIQIPYFYHVQV